MAVALKPEIRCSSATGKGQTSSRALPGGATFVSGLLRSTAIFLTLIFATLGFFPLGAFAGGPKYVAGTTYFNSGRAGTPLTWSQGLLNYSTDRGNLSPILPGASADVRPDRRSCGTPTPCLAARHTSRR